MHLNISNRLLFVDYMQCVIFQNSFCFNLYMLLDLLILELISCSTYDINTG